MSAFMVDEEHITVMVWAAVELASPTGSGPVFHYSPAPGARPVKVSRTDRESMNKVGQMLADANADSIRARYDEEAGYTYTYTRPKRADWQPVDILAAIDCYEYQACEVGDFENTEAARFCDFLRRGLINRLPGRGAAPWEITPTTNPAHAAA